MKYNCFKCDGKQKERDCYASNLNKEYCDWRIVADHDLVKYEKGDIEKTTLRTMLEQKDLVEETK